MIEQLISQYRIIKKLGAGGMGEVYLAEDTKLNREVALKLLSSVANHDRDRVRRFLQEARAAATLHHGNIAHIYEVGEANGKSFISMEYVEGQTLDAKISGRPLDVDQVVRIGIEAADALNEAHEKGIAHRDIKPSNIMITPRGHVKVLDFGLAKVTATNPQSAASDIPTQIKTSPGVVVGTVAYMSPEQALGREVDTRTDIFSLGVVLYEMATGRRPFTGATATETIDRIVHAPPEAIARFNYGAPVELERIIRKCLEKDRERRYQSARELEIDLKNLARDTQISGTIEGTTLQPRRDRRRFVWAVLTALTIALAGVAVYLLAGRGGKKNIDSVAILPFVNVGADSETEYLSDGITENLISNLSQLPNLRVMSRSSVFRYKGREVAPQVAGRELGVRAVLAGRAVQRGDNLAISLELMDVEDNRQIWGAQYNRKLADLAALQAEMSREISERLRLGLSAEERQQLAKRHSEDAEAYRLYLKGRFHWNKFTEDGIKKGIDYFNQAVSRDSGYALAYAGLADSYTALGLDYMRPKEAFPLAKIYALKALELDGTLPEAHAAMGAINFFYEWDWSGASREMKRIMELHPESAEPFSCTLHYLDATGRPDEAVAEIKRVAELHPTSLAIDGEIGCASYYARRYDQAIAELRQTLEMDPNYTLAHYNLGRAYGQKGLYDESIAALTKAKNLSEVSLFIRAELGYVYAASGKRDEARAVLRELRGETTRRYVDPYLIAIIHAGLGEKDQALVWLEKAFEDRSTWMPWLKLEPKFDGLRSDPRFANLMGRVGLPI